MNSIQVTTEATDRYPIRTGCDCLNELGDALIQSYGERMVAIIIDERVKQLHGERINAMMDGHNLPFEMVTIPSGEQSKQMDDYRRGLDHLLAIPVRRTTPVLVIGGGVTGDLGGFIASTVLRGLPLIHVPTTLLAMVDSSIGGKTGINHETGKNLIGSFYQPDLVFQDLHFLTTLPEKEWINGLSEIIKYAAIRTPELFSTIKEAISEEGFSVSDRWKSIIVQCAGIKANIVAEDVHESGIRAYLNYGHTFGHALERLADYGSVSHGEAVFIGMVAAGYYAQRMGEKLSLDRVEQFADRYHINMLTDGNDNLSPDALIEAMKYDKKIKRDAIRLVLLHNYGSPFVHTVGGDHTLLREAWQYAIDRIS